MAENPFVIDEGDLGGEWLRQAQLMRQVGRTEADAKHESAMAKVNLEVVAARLTIAIRNNPGEYDLNDRPNKEQVEAAVTLQPEYQKAQKQYLEADHYAALCHADTTAMIDRRKALENRVELLKLNYYSEDAEPVARSPEGRQIAKTLRQKSTRGGGFDDVD